MMLTTQTAILATRRGLTLGLVVQSLLWLGALTAAIAGPLIGSQSQVALALVVIAGIWMFLSLQSVRTARSQAEVPRLVAAGQYEAAEALIESILRSFSLFRPGKLMALHQLALLRHAQDRHQDAALLCRELLSQRLASGGVMGRSARLILAESSLRLGDLSTTAAMVAWLSVQPLPAGERLRLVLLQLDYQSRVGDWPGMFQGYMSKVQLAEVMPPAAAAAAQALLALAAKKMGREDVAGWLARRAALLADAGELVQRRPMLKELWPGAPAGRPEA
ncbi:MAG: hypothetical protein NZ561_13665 [Phycisphaerae bacterium]|nr:hypothetical protein [Phycisphaerae bacterium]MDW8263222.1 hypothetical protein [Phycisphaerales bacterium]